MQAGPAQLVFFLNQGCFQTELAGAECGGVSAGTATDNGNVINRIWQSRAPSSRKIVSRQTSDCKAIRRQQSAFGIQPEPSTKRFLRVRHIRLNRSLLGFELQYVALKSDRYQGLFSALEPGALFCCGMVSAAFVVPIRPVSLSRTPRRRM